MRLVGPQALRFKSRFPIDVAAARYGRRYQRIVSIGWGRRYQRIVSIGWGRRYQWIVAR